MSDLPEPESSNQPDDPEGAFPFAAPPVARGPETVINSDKQQHSAQPSASERNGSPAVNVLFPAAGKIVDIDTGAAATEIRLGHFRIVQQIGSGGMGAVFQAVDERLQRTVALKVLAPHVARDDQTVQRFQNEARAAAQLHHDSIAGVYYVGQDQGLHFIAYEYVAGTNLRVLIQEHGQMAPVEAVNSALQIAMALKQMDAAGVTHRDIKPSNIIVDSNRRSKLVDLGLARKQNENPEGDLTLAGTTMGTFDYISPEQAKDPRRVDVRSDIYSLGCTLYHMLAGEPPYPEGTMLQKLLDHQGKTPPDPAAKNRRVPGNLTAVVRRMMASNPKDRFQTPDQLIRELMTVARTLGLRSLSPDALIWAPAKASTRQFWERHLGWMSTAAALVLIVFLLQRFPQLEQNLSCLACAT
ncbi:MAG: serine/threonine-protein kinase [Planctomycetaceae bacterium]